MEIGQDCLLEIVNFLESSDALTLLQINSTWHKLLIKSDLFWKVLYRSMMMRRLQLSTRKNCKNRISELIQKHTNSGTKKMYQRDSMKEGELVFMKLMRKEIASKKLKDFEEQILTFSPNYFGASLEGVTKSIIEKKHQIISIIPEYNLLQKKYPFSTKYCKSLTSLIIHSRNLLVAPPYYNMIKIDSKQEKILSDTIYEVGCCLSEIDDVFALGFFELAFKIGHEDLLKITLKRMNEFGLSLHCISRLKLMENIYEIFELLLLNDNYESIYFQEFLKIFNLAFENKSKAIQYLQWNIRPISSEKQQILLENGFRYELKFTKHN